MAANNEEYDKAFQALMGPLMEAVSSTLNETEMGTMGKASETLKEQMPSPGLKVGTKAPDFTLPDALGNKVTLSDELENGPVILLFYRGAWCPVCTMHLNELKKLTASFREQYNNTQIIAITPQLPDISKKQMEESEFPFTVCSDLDDGVMKAYELHFDLDPELAEVYKKFNFQVEKDNGGDGRLSLPVPGTFVIDQKSIIRAMHADTDYTNRMKPAEITAALEKVKSDNVGAVKCGCTYIHSVRIRILVRTSPLGTIVLFEPQKFCNTSTRLELKLTVPHSTRTCPFQYVKDNIIMKIK